MTYQNCKRLLAHYEEAMQDGYLSGNPPTPLDAMSKENMRQAYEDMRAHMAEVYGEVEEPKKKSSKKSKEA